MSFITDFKTIIEGDPSLNALVTGGIKFGHLSENFDITKTWVAWDYRIADQVNTFGCNAVYTTYSISITLTATDTIIMNNMNEYLRTYLNNKVTNNFVDIKFISDSKITALNKVVNTYQVTSEYSAIYV